MFGRALLHHHPAGLCVLQPLTLAEHLQAGKKDTGAVTPAKASAFDAVAALMSARSSAMPAPAPKPAAAPIPPLPPRPDVRSSSFELYCSVLILFEVLMVMRLCR